MHVQEKYFEMKELKNIYLKTSHSQTIIDSFFTCNRNTDEAWGWITLTVRKENW